MSEFRLRILMQRSASPFVISNAVRDAQLGIHRLDGPVLVAGVTGTLGKWRGRQPVACGQKTTGREPVRTALVLAELSGWEV